MTTRNPSRSLVYALVFVVALPLILGAARAVGNRPTAELPGNRSVAVHSQPHPVQGPDVEVLVGELNCQPNPFESNTFLAFRVGGTVQVTTSGMGEFISNTLTTPEAPCPGIFAGATEALQDVGCTAGSVAAGSLKFVCHDHRDAILEVIAMVSDGVLVGGF